MRSAKEGNFFLSDKAAIQLLRGVEVFDAYEAYNSIQMDINCGKKWSYRGYSSLWGWNKGKVKRFVDALLSPEGLTQVGQLKLKKPVHIVSDSNRPAIDQQQTSNVPPKSATVGENSDTMNQQRTSNRPAIDRTIDTETKTKKRHVQNELNFDTFWATYPNKKNKKKAKQIWMNRNLGNGKFDIIMSSLDAFKKSPEWTKEDGKFIPMPTTWLNGDRWEDEKTEKVTTRWQK